MILRFSDSQPQNIFYSIKNVICFKKFMNKTCQRNKNKFIDGILAFY